MAVVGGGAAGFMTAITAAENGVKRIIILEGTSKLMEKVRISGGEDVMLLMRHGYRMN